MRTSERVSLEIKRLSSGGEGIATPTGWSSLFPMGAGDTLEVELTETHKRFARARVLRILEPSKDRVTPPCPYHFQLED